MKSRMFPHELGWSLLFATEHGTIHSEMHMIVQLALLLLVTMAKIHNMQRMQCDFFIKYLRYLVTIRLLNA